MSRHSSISRKSTPRQWRSPSKPTDPQASLSLVFAEPEHSVLGGAATLSPTQQADDAGRNVDPPFHRPDRPDAASSLRRASYASLRSLSKQIRSDSAAPDSSVNQDTPTAHAHGEVPATTTFPLEPVGVDQPSMSRSPNNTTASRQPSQRAGWFSSLGRRARIVSLESEEEHMQAMESPAETLRTSVSTQVDIPPMTPKSTIFESAPSTTVGIPFPASELDPTPQRAVKDQPKSQGGGWFSSKAAKQIIPVTTSTNNQTRSDTQSSSEPLQASLPPNLISRRPTPPRHIPLSEKAAGFDGVEPPTPGISPPTTDISVPSSIDDTVPTVSSFSPPSSPNPVPLRPRERTLSNLSSLNPSSSRFTLSMPLLGRPKVPLDQIVAQVEQAEAASESSDGIKGSTQPEADSAHDSVQTPQGSVVSGTSSWWGYIGLGSSTSALLPTLPFTNSPSSTVESQPSTRELPSGVMTLNALAPIEKLNAPSIGSTESATAWYSPWRWYNGANIHSVMEPVSTAKTQAELIKEEALARSEPSSSQSILSPSDPTELPAPVVTSVESRASWISFFSPQSVPSVNVRTTQENAKVVVSKIHNDAHGAVRPSEASWQRTAPNLNSPSSPISIGPPEASKRSSSDPPLTKDDDIKIQSPASERPSSPTSQRSLPSSRPRPANLLLPIFEDTFNTPPRSIPVPQSTSTIRRAIRCVSGFLFPEDKRGKWKGTETPLNMVGHELSRTWGVLGEQELLASGGLKGVKRVVVIGIHGWFPGSIIRYAIGEPTGTSLKFANMLASAVEDHCSKHGAVLDKLTKIVLEGEGTIEQRVNSLYQEYLRHEDWVEDLQKADAILLATHSQGSIVSTQLLHRLINEGHIRTPKNGSGVVPEGPHISSSSQRVCCVAMCGIHMGPLLSLNTSSLVNPYIQYLESAAARELFEFQDTESPVSRTYVKALKDVLEHGVKFTYIASLNDQVVPIYSGCFSTVAHPLILRALYIDGDAYNSSDFLSNLLVLLLRIRNAGLDDGGLITHLSEATAGSLNGVGHSSAYEEPASYSLAVRFLFETSGTLSGQHELEVQPFTARAARNDYEIPWALRDLIANPDVASLFSSDISELRTAFDEWHPRTTRLRAIRRKLEPIRRLPRPKL